MIGIEKLVKMDNMWRVQKGSKYNGIDFMYRNHFQF